MQSLLEINCRKERLPTFWRHLENAWYMISKSQPFPLNIKDFHSFLGIFIGQIRPYLYRVLLKRTMLYAHYWVWHFFKNKHIAITTTSFVNHLSSLFSINLKRYSILISIPDSTYIPNTLNNISVPNQQIHQPPFSVLSYFMIVIIIETNIKIDSINSGEFMCLKTPCNKWQSLFPSFHMR